MYVIEVLLFVALGVLIGIVLSAQLFREPKSK